MAKRKDLTKEDILRAMRITKSNRSASRYLHCCYHHYKKWAKLYVNEDNISLFDLHKNQCGKGIPKFLKGDGRDPILIDIIEGRADPSPFSAERLKYKLITEGHIAEECANCGFKERRVLDYKMPLILYFKDKDKSNYRRENIDLFCYNCYFLYVKDIFTEIEVKSMEEHVSVKTAEVKWDIDSYTLKRLKELGLDGIEKDEDDDYSLVSRK